eukprot:7404607-Pyramimonas_sp.AAC.1
MESQVRGCPVLGGHLLHVLEQRVGSHALTTDVVLVCSQGRQVRNRSHDDLHGSPQVGAKLRDPLRLLASGREARSHAIEPTRVEDPLAPRKLLDLIRGLHRRNESGQGVEDALRLCGLWNGRLDLGHARIDHLRELRAEPRQDTVENLTVCSRPKA